jgi:hypothetical protein
MNLPSVSIAFLSWNRLHYLRATLESALECIQYPSLEWVVSDNESIETGLKEYLKNHPRLDRVLCRTQTHAAAMNELVETCCGDYILIWPEDVQFVVRGDWLRDVVEVMEANPWIGSVGLDAQRRATLDRFFAPPSLSLRLRDFKAFRTQRKVTRLKSSRGFGLFTLGPYAPGVCGSGIPTLTRRSLWQEMGGWKTGPCAGGLIDSSLGAEDRMVETFYRSGRPLQMAMLDLPVAADILTDPLGCKAKVRGAYRFGVYMPPPQPPFYYKIHELSDVQQTAHNFPLDFNDVTEALGFSIPRDANGDRKKASFNASVVHHIAERRDIPFPLSEAALSSLLSK